jgi:hypothetical protein
VARTYKVFISHSWSYIDELTALRNLLENRGYFKVEFEEATPDVPINSTNATYIKQRLKEKILNSDIVLGIAGVYASHSDWMIWELETAKEARIPIVGVIPWGQERISSEVYNRSIVDVNWNTEGIVEAIRSHSK